MIIKWHVALVTVFLSMLPMLGDASDFFMRSRCVDPNQKLCLTRKAPLNQNVVLLGIGKSKTCKTRSRQHQEIFDKPGPAVTVTVLDSLHCEDFQFNIAYVGAENPTYEIVNFSRIFDSTTVKSIDKVIRERAHMIEFDGAEHPSKLSTGTPEIYLVPGLTGGYIGVYENAAPSGDQIHVLYIKGKIFRIIHAAKMQSAFRINGNLFIHYTFSCHIGCGWHGDFIFAITEKGAARVLFDDSWST